MHSMNQMNRIHNLHLLHFEYLSLSCLYGGWYDVVLRVLWGGIMVGAGLANSVQDSPPLF